MITLNQLSQRLNIKILRRTQRNLRNFTDLGIDSRPDLISLENCEYVAELLAIERFLPSLERSAHDRVIVLRVCDQFSASGIPELREWAIAQLHQDKEKLKQQIQNCQEVALPKILERLENLEVTTCN